MEERAILIAYVRLGTAGRPVLAVIAIGHIDQVGEGRANKTEEKSG
jgi:hypothetical protein